MEDNRTRKDCGGDKDIEFLMMLTCTLSQTGEFYNNESKMLAAVSKFKKDPLTKVRMLLCDFEG